MRKNCTEFWRILTPLGMALMSIVHEAKLNIDYRVGTYSFFMIEGVMQKMGGQNT